ncbi:MAG: hypothetical protein JWN64_482 [Parcubacteria group bacterium]|nr:hypothetical protein [Parcubacteria group bacterium]
MPFKHMLKPVRKIGPLFESNRFKDVKDPCVAFDGTTWHIYGTAGDTFPEEWEILHATAPAIEGPWTELGVVNLRGVEGPHVCAPTVVYDPEDKLFHMAVQKDFMDVGGGLAYLVSADGHTFTKMRTLMRPTNESEAGLYDPQLSTIKGKKYLVYSGIPEMRAYDTRPRPVPQPDVYLAKSSTDYWSGHWKRMKAILRHEDIAWHHNHREHPDYEWGIEGPEVRELPGGKILLNATCFIEEGRRGTRQRVFFAMADDVKGPYTTIGPVLPTEGLEEWENGENGHASTWIMGDELYLFYQARPQTVAEPIEANAWKYGIAIFKIEDLLKEFEAVKAETITQ